jgi:cellulose synthase/poly-beta-1,6-N-acetylglucosamine synthase-like glycosyltransferase
VKVRTADETDVSPRRAARYAAVVGGVVGLVTLPALASSPYATALRSVLLVLLLGLVVRTHIGALLAVRSESPPDVDLEDPPTVSIVVPAYNEASVLGDTIDAALAVDYPAETLEIVVCYEADSTDATGEIAERYAAANEPVVAVERDEPGGGKAKATNYALRYATGEVIASIDADHEFAPDAVRRAVRYFVADPATWCVKGRCFGSNPTDSLLALHATVERHIAELADLYGREVFGGFTVFGGGQAFFRRELFDELGAFDEEVLVEDIDMSARIHAAGKRLRVDPDVVTYEENPVTLEAWWSQRTRWARGWMQVAVRYLPTLPFDTTLSRTERADAAYTFLYALVPVVFVIAAPMFLLDRLLLTGGTTVPYDRLLWSYIGVGPIVAALLVFARDRLHGYDHHPTELLAAGTLWFYLFGQAAVYVVAFLDEFVFDRESVYVTTTRADAPADD